MMQKIKYSLKKYSNFYMIIYKKKIPSYYDF